MSAKTLAVLLVRLTGFLSVAGGALFLVSGVLASWGKIGLVYWQTFLLTVVLPPLLFIAGGLVLWGLARPLSGLLAAGLGDPRAEPAPAPRFRSAPRSEDRRAKE